MEFNKMEEKSDDLATITTMFTTITNTLQTMDNKLEKLIAENDQIKQENRKLKEIVEKQENKIAALERETRRKNLIIKGVPDDGKENWEETIKTTMKIIEKIGVNVTKEADIDEAKRVGRYRRNGQRPILLKLTTGNKKAEILSKSKELKGSNMWIDEDYTKEILEERKTLIIQLKDARKKGYRAQLKYNKLIINNEVYEAKDFITKDLEKEREHIDEEEQTTGIKRTVSERSPTNDTVMDKLKISRTTKN